MSVKMLKQGMVGDLLDRKGEDNVWMQIYFIETAVKKYGLEFILLKRAK